MKVLLQICIGFFLHIPFPSSELYKILPVRSEILNGVLDCDLIGFHTYGQFTSHRKPLSISEFFVYLSADSIMLVISCNPVQGFWVLRRKRQWYLLLIAQFQWVCFLSELSLRSSWTTLIPLLCCTNRRKTCFGWHS